MQKYLSKKIKTTYKYSRKVVVDILYLISTILPDYIFLKLIFRLKMGYKLDLDNPQTFSEKLQWLKLYNRKPEYTTMVDKAAVKEYVAKIIGEEYIIPTLGVWDRFEDIDFESLPNQFVLKTTHGGGNTGVVICKDKSSFDKESAKAKLNKSLKNCIYRRYKEWPYKNVKHRIIAEEYITDSTGELNDYKFFCFNGEPKVMLVSSERLTSVKFDYFDINFNHLPFEQGGPNSKKQHARPHNMDKMVDISTKLSSNIPHVRVDLYDVDGKVYFGELTFFDSSGYAKFEPEEWNYEFGKWLKLPAKTIN